MTRTRILIACESSGIIREAFRAWGHDAWSCDLLPAEDGSPHHFQCDVRDLDLSQYDMLGFHPDCTFLTVAGIHWNNRGRGWERTEQAVEFARWCMSHDVPWYLENPVSILSTRIRKPDQSIQPYQFGEDASKRTCLWLNGLPPLTIDPAKRRPGRTVEHKGRTVERWSNQTDSGQNKLPPSENRWRERARTYPGIAHAMAEQWTISML